MTLQASVVLVALPLLSQLFSSTSAYALPASSSYSDDLGQGPIHLALTRRTTPASSSLDYFRQAADRARLKHGYAAAGANSGVVSTRRRAGISRASSPLNVDTKDQFIDFSYSTTISFGTPPQDFDIVLDTGSGDLWVSTSPCTTCAANSPLFNSAKSTTFQGTTTTVELTYGKGEIQGDIATDAVTMGGVTIKDQVFIAANVVADSPVTAPHSGILGLELATGRATTETNKSPLWVSLLNATSAATPEMAFYMQRHVNDTSVQDADQETPGGVFTLGGTNSSFFNGDIEFLDAANTGLSRWFLNVNNVTVQGKTVPITTGDATLAAIDTGTSLIGGPSADVEAIWAAVPGSAPLPSMPGFFSFPCTTPVQVSVSFGGKSWAIDPVDINLGPVSTNGDLCGGAIFDLTAGSNVPLGNGNPGWLMGDTFLKNVYAVFRAEPLSIGFAQLSDTALGATSLSSSPSGSSGSSGNVQKPKNGALSSVVAPAKTFLGAAGVGIVMFCAEFVF